MILEDSWILRTLSLCTQTQITFLKQRVDHWRALRVGCKRFTGFCNQLTLTRLNYVWWYLYAKDFGLQWVFSYEKVKKEKEKPTTDPVLVFFPAAVSDFLPLLQAALKLCLLQPHVLQTAIRLGLDLLALRRKLHQQVRFTGVPTATSVHCFCFPFCQTKTLF